jgi:hypothetical protein
MIKFEKIQPGMEGYVTLQGPKDELEPLVLGEPDDIATSWPKEMDRLRRENEDLRRLLKRVEWISWEADGGVCVWCRSHDCYATPCADRRRAAELTR